MKEGCVYGPKNNEKKRQKKKIKKDRRLERRAWEERKNNIRTHSRNTQ